MATSAPHPHPNPIDVGEVRDYAIFSLDTGGHVVSWNEGARRLNGYAPEEIHGRHFSILFTDEDRAAGKPREEVDLARANGRHAERLWRVRKDGSRFWAE